MGCFPYLKVGKQWEVSKSKAESIEAMDVKNTGVNQTDELEGGSDGGCG
jgi:hypothetical protein